MSEPTKNDTPESASPAAGASADATRDFVPGTAHRAEFPGIQVPGYKMLSILGRGGMGVVYEALQEKANRVVALKMILAGALADAHDRTRFRMEAEAVASLSHPNIVQLFEVGETAEGYPFFSLEYVGGGTLADRLKMAPLPAHAAAELVEALARAMQYAHEHGIVHRDLKPLNVLFHKPDGQAHLSGTGKSTLKGNTAAPPVTSTESRARQPGVPKISDFGLAKRLDSDDGLTRTGAILGSPTYMAPEQAFGHSRDVGPAADIYALGAILYECLTGRPPFRGATVADTLDQVRTMEPISVRAYAKEIPTDLETICLHCLHKDPQRRYASAEALADDLHRFQEHKPIVVRPVSTFERSWRWCRRNPGWAGMIGAVLLLGATIIGGLSYGVIAISEERNEAHLQRIKAQAEEKKAQREEKKARIAQKEAEAKTVLAKSRLDDSIHAVGLFATDARTFCDDAMVPGDSRAKLYKVLVDQLEKQAATQEAGELSADALRNQVWMYLNIANVYNSQANSGPAEAYFKKGITAADQWLKLDPENAHAQSHRAGLFFSYAILLKAGGRDKEARARFTEALEVRRRLLDNAEVDQFSPGKSMTDLAASLDAAHEFGESLVLRERVHALFVQRGLNAFKPLDDWAWTCLQASDLATDFTRKKELLTKADELCEKAVALRPGSRPTRTRWAKAAKEHGELEYNHGKLAAQAQKLDEAQQHFDNAQQQFKKYAIHAKALSTSFDMVEQLRNYSRSFYTLGLIERERGRLDEARENFTICLHIREQCLRDYRGHLFETPMKFDHLFALVAVGAHEKAHVAADKLHARNRDASNLYRLACIHALSVPSVEEARRPQPLTADDRLLQGVYRARALECLEESFKAGWSNFQHTRVDADLASIRTDPRFEAILKKFEKK